MDREPVRSIAARISRAARPSGGFAQGKRVALVGMRAALIAVLLSVAALPVWAQRAGRVHAVLFYSPTCPHCHQVLSVDLPPLVQQHGERLQILTINTASPAGQALYQAVVRHYAIPDERLGVPTVVVGETVLVGSGEIPEQFPGIIERGLAGEGIDWPAVPALLPLLEAQGLLDTPAAPAPTRETAAVAAAPPGEPAAARGSRATPETAPVNRAAAPGAASAAPPEAGPAGPRTPDGATAADSASARPAASAAAPHAPGLIGIDGVPAVPPAGLARFRLDPVGNTIAVAVLFAMLAALVAVAAAVARRLTWPAPPSWVTPVLAVLGMAVASYLSWVELTGATAVCGPVGDCNTVQQSSFAKLWGLVPVGVLGLVGYVVLLVAWGVDAAGPQRHRVRAQRLLWAAALAGTVFSIYLTFLEPFVIGATCAWCITSALLITTLLLVATPRAHFPPPAAGPRGSGPATRR